jgi:hypothetical protein
MNASMKVGVFNRRPPFRARSNRQLLNGEDSVTLAVCLKRTIRHSTTENVGHICDRRVGWCIESAGEDVL